MGARVPPIGICRPCTAVNTANSAEQTVCRVKKTSIPIHEDKKRTLRPSLSTRKEAVMATAKFQICRIPFIRS